MTREERVKSCEICLKRKFSFQQGIICGITDAVAVFEGKCIDFKEDEKAVEQVELKNEIRQKEKIEEDSLGLSKFGIKSGITAGIIFIVLAIIWFVVGIVAFNRVFFYPAALVIIGLIAIGKGVKQKRGIKIKRDSTILDSEI